MKKKQKPKRKPSLHFTVVAFAVFISALAVYAFIGINLHFKLRFIENSLTINALLLAILVVAFTIYESLADLYKVASQQADTSMLVFLLEHREALGPNSSAAAILKVKLSESQYYEGLARMENYSGICCSYAIWILLGGIIIELATGVRVTLVVTPIAFDLLMGAILINVLRINAVAPNSFMERIILMPQMRLPPKHAQVQGAIDTLPWLKEYLNEL
jgi:hypothetical protein